MEYENLRSKYETETKNPVKKILMFFYIAIGLLVFISAFYWTMKDMQNKIEHLKWKKQDLISDQRSACTELKRELENLVRKELFQESFKNQQENIKDGIFMYSINESTSTNRQLEITKSLDSVCTKNEKQIKEVEQELVRLATALF